MTEDPPMRCAAASFMLLTLTLMAWGCASSPATRAGTTRPNAALADGFEVWQPATQQWVDAETFLADHLAATGPRTYRDAPSFPPYATTQEHDTMKLLVGDDGSCQLYFYHRAWRRLADTEAWGQELRDYKACKVAFDRAIPFRDAP